MNDNDNDNDDANDDGNSTLFTLHSTLKKAQDNVPRFAY